MIHKALVLAALLMLAACGSRAPVVDGGRLDAPVAAQRFSDARPVEFPGLQPGSLPVHGIDVARYQGAIDWPTAQGAGVSFAFIKATEGGDRVDAGFAGHWAGAGAAGVRRGAYHFYYFCTPPEVQARWFIANVPRTAGMMPPVLDLEWNPDSPTCDRRPDGATVRAEVAVWMDIVGSHYGQRPIIYTAPDFWDDAGLVALTGEEFWLRSVRNDPAAVYGGRGWSFWQYSGSGLVAGIPGEVDLNAFAGGLADWRAWLARRAP